MTARTIASALLAGVTITAGAAVVAAPAEARAADCTAAASPEIAIGSPKATVDGVARAGSVEIRDACDPGVAAQVLTLPEPKAGDAFGFAIADVNLAFDGAQGFLIGIPQYDVGDAVDAGAVAAYRKLDGRYVLDRIITQDTPGIPGDVQAGAKFGAAVSSHVEEPEMETQSVRIGAPRLDVGSAKDAGGVVVLAYDICRLGQPVDPDCREPAGTPIDQLTFEITLDSPGVPWVAHAGDQFGAALGGPYLDRIGAPGRTIHGHADAGAVLTNLPAETEARREQHPPTWVSQQTPRVDGTAEAGDRFGSALAGYWIGVPGEDVNGHADAGIVNRYDQDKFGSLSELNKGFQGAQHAGDRFGATLLEDHSYDSDAFYEPRTLFIGAPGADTAAGRNSGSVSWILENEPVGTPDRQG